MTRIAYKQSDHPFPSVRRSVYAKNGMVATTQPLAAQAGLDVLRRGGNAVDAAITTAICLTVLEPVSNGVGGDAFALVWMDGALHGLNGSGVAPMDISIDKLRARGLSAMPKRGLVPVMVPGAPAAWVTLSKRFGRLPFRALVAPAIEYARQGFPLSPAICHYWNKAIGDAKTEFVGPEFEEWFRVFNPTGDFMEPGQVMRFPDLAHTLQLLADSEGESFYRGETAAQIVAFMRQHGGYLSKEDFAAYSPEWMQPISMEYRGYDVWELPPNCQGLVALEALNILKNADFSATSPLERYHLQFETMKMAFDDGLANITDPRCSQVDFGQFLQPAYGQELFGRIAPAAPYQPAMEPLLGGTVFLAAADSDGNMVSFIQSNFEDFGSGVVVSGTGVNLQNRGSSFLLDESKPNCLAPGKRTYHTIIPGFLTKNSHAVGPFGVMGCFMQPQGHVQVLMNMLDFGMNPQAALDAPRWQWTGGKHFKVEPGIPDQELEGLRKKGHEIEVCDDAYSFGRGQIIWRDSESGTLAGGTDSRSDGVVAAW